jgi:hypothetical protein
MDGIMHPYHEVFPPAIPACDPDQTERRFCEGSGICRFTGKKLSNYLNKKSKQDADCRDNGGTDTAMDKVVQQDTHTAVNA